MSKTLGDLAIVRAELTKKFGEQNINIRALQYPAIIFVTYVNSPLNQKTAAERAERAQETAETVRQVYPSIKNVREIRVGFMRVTTRLLVFHRSEMIEVLGFNGGVPDVGPPPPSGRPGLPYSPSQNRTEISNGGIQLEGTAEKGLILIPHFSVAGDANKIKPKPPDEVGLDFASFSDKPKFPNLTKIVFLSDDKIVYRTEEQFSTSKIADGTYSEFLYLKVPTAVFLKISSGRVVKIKLNQHEYTLTEGQLEQIQRMSDDYLR